MLVAHQLGIVSVTGAATHVALLRDDDRDGFGNLHGFAGSLLCFLDRGAASVAVKLGRFFCFLGNNVFERLFVGKDLLECVTFGVELFHFLFHTLVLEFGQLAQTQFQNVFGLQFSKPELGHQGLLGLVFETHDFDHSVDVVDCFGSTFQNVKSRIDLIESSLSAASHRLQSGLHPFGQNLLQRFLRRTTVVANHHQIHRRVALKTRLTEEHLHKKVSIDLGTLGFKHQAHLGVFVAFVAHAVKHREHRCLAVGLFGRDGFFACFRLGIGNLFDL